MTDMPSELSEPVRRWMVQFAAAVRERDFELGRSLVAEDVFSFGTVRAVADSVEELESGQWAKVWPFTFDFDFDYKETRQIIRDGLVVVMTLWSSHESLHGVKGASRNGRATLILQTKDNRFVATHTHFSLNPKVTA